MNIRHTAFLLLVFAAGYVFSCYYPGIGQKLGLPA
jgi:hypothetical protein